jgi:ADP-ribose pyrophosphatase YjhB (NUDIX family)
MGIIAGTIKNAMNAAPLTHAGGLVVRTTDGRPEVLLVRPKDGSDVWVLPKGHIERGELPEETAVREVAEETGVVATVDRLLERVAFRAKGEDVRVAFYLMRCRKERKGIEDRAIQWVSPVDAERLLSHAESVRVLRLALPFLTAQESAR